MDNEECFLCELGELLNKYNCCFYSDFRYVSFGFAESKLYFESANSKIDLDSAYVDVDSVKYALSVLAQRSR